MARRETHRTFLLYKPPGCVTTLSDPQGRPTAASYLAGAGERLFPVGRLDFDGEGAVLFTTDGALAHRLAHPRYGHRRTYLVKVKGEPTSEQLRRMAAGARLDDGPARALECALDRKAERNTWVRLVVGEGRYHLVKRLCEAVGLSGAAALPPRVRRGIGGGAAAGRVPRPRPASPRALRSGP